MAAADASSSRQQEPIKVALIPPSSGALAVFGADAAKAWQFAADEVNAKGGVDGHKVEIIKSSTDAQPANTVRAARKAVTQDGAKFIGAVMTSPEHGALQQQLAGMNAMSINALGKDDALTGEGCSPNAFRAVQSTSWTSTRSPPRWRAAREDVGDPGRRLRDRAHLGREVQGGRRGGRQERRARAVRAAGHDRVRLLHHQAQGSGADGLFAVEYGADGVAFVNQGAQFKLFDQFKTVLGFNMVSEPLFETLGDKVIGFYNNLGYDASADNPMNKAFVDAWTAKNGSAPYYVAGRQLPRRADCCSRPSRRPRASTRPRSRPR